MLIFFLYTHFFPIKRFVWINVSMIFILINTQCVTQAPDIQTMDSNQKVLADKGLNYSSAIETLTVRLVNRFKPENLSSDQSLPVIFITSEGCKKKKISLLHGLLINDLSQSLQKEGFEVRKPYLLMDNAKDNYPGECQSRFNALDWDIHILISSEASTLSIDSVRIILDINYQKKHFSETCHLSLTPDLKTKKNNFHYIPNPLGHIKKPFRNFIQAYEFIVESTNCLITKLLPQVENYRLLIAKTDNTKPAIIEAFKKQWISLLGADRIAQTVIPIDFYADQFVMRDKEISEIIPKDIKLIMALDSMEINPGKYRIRCQLLTLSLLDVQLPGHPAIPSGKCIPGCQFNIYTHTKAKGKTLIADGSGKCLKNALSSDLWSYSAKTLAEKAAKDKLFNKVKAFMRKDLIRKNKIYNESNLDKNVRNLMKNAVLEWENFDENSCMAEARYIIYASFLPFDIPEDISKQIDISEDIPKQIDMSKDIPKQTIDKETFLIEDLNKTIQNRLIDDKIIPKIVKKISVEGVIQKKECISSLGQAITPSQKVRCVFNYDLTFFYDNQKLCLSKGFANSFGDSLSSSQQDIVSTLVDLLYPFPLDISLALSDKISKEELLKILMNLDEKYFNLVSDFDTFIQFIEKLKVKGF